MSTILIIDDEPGVRSVLKDILEDEKYQVFTAGDGYSGLALMEKETIDLVILDVWMPNMGGVDVLKKIKETYPLVEVIMISGHANIDLAVKAVKLGAFDFLEKPLSLDRVLTLTRNALEMEKLRQENIHLKHKTLSNDEIIGTSPAIQKIQELIRQSAGSDSRILISGPNGTGKELVAREIHRKSARAQGPFIEVNCAAIPDTLIESELFGHEKGSFTGAVSRRKGKFELAHKGTLFLDEVADMSLSAQAKVLRVIQELRFERIGGEESISVDVRLIAATNKNIPELIRAGKFREDLYFRLNVIPLYIPSLSERIQDLPLLVSYFMEKFKPESISSPRTFTTEAMEYLKAYPWPGNIRELKNFIERINIMSDEECISLETVKYYLGEENLKKKDDTLGKFSTYPLNKAKEEFEKLYIEKKLEEFNHNISKTAEMIGIYPSNLHSKIKRYGIRIER
ncbi:MAG: sigma-54-dependent Fis family transcriptional regulator [Spirochaetales bacterium]|nr:sigma-54-dependent Fis family transcriptional regulator [Spirochaetales bacterium]